MIPDLVLDNLLLDGRRLVVRLYGPPRDGMDAVILTDFAELGEFTRMPRPRGQEALRWARPMDLNLRT